MKKSALMLLAGTTMALTTAAFGQVYSSSPAIAIPTTASATAYSNSIVVAGGPASITDLNVVFRCTHTWDSDVDVVLEGPNGHICLSTDNGGSGDNYSTTRFDDLATGVIGSTGNNTAPFNGNYKPEGLINGVSFTTPATFLGTNQATLAGFNGTDSNGTWTMYVGDNTGGDGGTWSYWSLEFNGTFDPNGPAPLGSPTNPTGVAAIGGATACPGTARLFTVTVTPGTFPASTGLAVSANLSAAGGSASQAFFDDGTNGDVTAGDNIWSYSFTTVSSGAFTAMPYTITDAQARSGGGTFGTLTVNSCVSGEPGTFIDLGALGATPVSNDQSYTPGQVRWYKFSVGGVSDPSAYLDIWTVGGANPGTNTDTEIGLYDAAGNLVNTDDDDGNNNYSAQSFGRITPNRAAVGNSALFNGRDGALAAGTYWLAVCEFAATFNTTNWSINVTPVDTGDIQTNIVYFVDSQPTNPTGVGSGGVVAECGGNVVATVAVTGGLNPASTGISVSLDTTAIGGGSVAMLDNGTGGDATAGDNIFSATVAVPGGADQVYALPFTVSDAQARSSNGSLNVTRSAAEVGDLPSNAKMYYGVSGNTITGNMTANDADMFAICISDTAAFDATTIDAGATWDSQLFLFNADGTGALTSDDDTAVAGFSHINAAAAANPGYTLTSGGLYYLAVSAYNKDPISSALATDTIWANQNDLASFLGTYGPNGVTPTAPIAGWTAGGTTTRAYTITMTGATTVCPADLSGGTAGVPDCAVDINDLLYFLGAFEAGNADLDNGSGNGVRDCATDINDLLFFLVRFEAGC